MQEEILLNIESKEIRYAHLRNGRLHDLIIERKKARQLAGNIYRGRVTNILHNIQSAFIDISEGENGFIHISDILENTKKFEENFDMDFDLNHKAQSDTSKPKVSDIAQVMKADQSVLVQVVKEPIGTKGARLTSNLSIPGRYLVLLPNSQHRGVSRKIEDRSARDRLKRLIRAFEMPQDMGLICRTASRNAEPEALIAEAHDLLATWQQIRETFDRTNKPGCLYRETDLIKRAVLTAVDKKFARILIDDYATYQTCKRLYQNYESEHPLRVEYYRDKAPIFERFSIERDIEKALQRKIWLPSGGYLFFDRTEAMTTIDVNSGRGSGSSSDVEETLVRLNLEAADEISRQLRLRNVGGLIVCDFVDMRSRKNQRRVLDRLKEAMREDSAKCTILGMSEFGLVEMTRQRSRESLQQTMCTHCSYCGGDGMIKTYESMAIELERALKKAILIEEQYALLLVCHPYLLKYLRTEDENFLVDLAERYHASLKLGEDDRLHVNEYRLVSQLTHQEIVG